MNLYQIHHRSGLTAVLGSHLTSVSGGRWWLQGNWRGEADDKAPHPPRKGSRCNFFLLQSGRERCWESFVWITSLRSRLPLLDLYLPLALPAGWGGARVATLAFCARLRSSDQAGPGPLLCSGSDLGLLGMKVSKAAERALASLNFSTTVSMEVPKSSEGETGASRRRPFSFFSRSAKFTHRCHSVTTIAAMDLPIAVAACLVAQRAKSVVRRSSATSSGDKPWPSSRSFSRSAWYAWSTAMVCNEATAWPAAAYALPFKRDVSWRDLNGKEGTFREACVTHREIAS